VVYLPSYEEDDNRRRAETNDAIATAGMLQCSARPYRIIPLGEQDLQVNSVLRCWLGPVTRLRSTIIDPVESM